MLRRRTFSSKKRFSARKARMVPAPSSTDQIRQPTRHNVDAELRFCHTELHPLLNVLCTPPHKLWATSLGLRPWPGVQTEAGLIHGMHSVPNTHTCCFQRHHKKSCVRQHLSQGGSVEVAGWNSRCRHVQRRCVQRRCEGVVSLVDDVVCGLVACGLWLVACGLWLVLVACPCLTLLTWQTKPRPRKPF